MLNTRASYPIVFVQEHDQNTTAAESVDGGGVPAQNSTNDGLMFVLSTDLVKSPEDDVQPDSQYTSAGRRGHTGCWGKPWYYGGRGYLYGYWYGRWPDGVGVGVFVPPC